MQHGTLNSLATPPRRAFFISYGAPVAAGLVAFALCYFMPLQSMTLMLIVAIATGAAFYFFREARALRRTAMAQAMLLDLNESTFLAALDGAMHGMALISREGKWLRVNKAVTRIVGYSAEELEKLDFQTITHPDDLYADMHYVEQILSQKIETYSMEKRYIRKDGSIIWIQLSVSATWDPEGNFRYFISEIQDIHERKMLQERLRASEARLRNH